MLHVILGAECVDHAEGNEDCEGAAYILVEAPLPLELIKLLVAQYLLSVLD